MDYYNIMGLYVSKKSAKFKIIYNIDFDHDHFDLLQSSLYQLEKVKNMLI